MRSQNVDGKSSCKPTPIHRWKIPWCSCTLLFAVVLAVVFFCLFQVQSLCYLAFGFEFLLSYTHVPDTGAMLSSGITIYSEISPRYVDLFFEPRISPGRGGETLTPAWLIGWYWITGYSVQSGKVENWYENDKWDVVEYNQFLLITDLERPFQTEGW